MVSTTTMGAEDGAGGGAFLTMEEMGAGAGLATTCSPGVRGWGGWGWGGGWGAAGQRGTGASKRGMRHQRHNGRERRQRGL